MEELQNRTKLKLICEYDGSNYSGWASSPSNLKKSVQEVVVASWMRLFPQTSFLSVKASSRTDSGVHALGQVVTIESDIVFGTEPVITPGMHKNALANRKARKQAPRPINGQKSHINSEPGRADELYKRINSFLPQDVVFKSSKTVSLNFSAKDHSRRRMYRYEILNHPIRCAIGRSYLWHIKNPMDVAKMTTAAEMLLGTHDMSPFCPTGYLPEDKSKRIKNIEVSRISSMEDGRITYEVVGNSFMYKQVRNMVGMLADVGMGRLTLEQLKTILEDGARVSFQGAPAQGLTLVWVEHDSEMDNCVSGPTEAGTSTGKPLEPM
jgi:tRNA pseudouridine38-40 synthase